MHQDAGNAKGAEQSRAWRWAVLVALLAVVGISGPTLASRAALNGGLLLISRAIHGPAQGASGALQRASRWLERAADWDAAGDLTPGVHTGLAIIAERTDNQADAVARWRQAGYTAATLAAAGDQLSLGRAFAQAAAWYERAAAVAPQEPSHWLALGRCYAHQKRWAAALDAYERGARQAAPTASGYSSLYLEIGLLRTRNLKLADADAALRAWDAALQADAFRDADERVQALVYRAQLYMDAGRHIEALQDYLAIVTLRPTHYTALLRLGRLYWSVAGDAASAEQSLLAAAAVKPAAKQPYLRLGALYESTNRPAEALRAYQRVLELDARDATARRAVERLSQ